MTSQNKPSQWFDAKDESKATRETVNTYIDFRLKQYKSTTLRDDSLWEVFHEDFENWIDTTFSKADSYILYDLRDYLRQNGVFVETGRGKRLSVGLAKVLQEEDPHKWNPTEIKDQIEKSVFNSRWNRPKMEVDYIASPRAEATQKEIKPRYRQSRVNDDIVHEEKKRLKESQHKPFDDDDNIDDFRDEAPMTKQISDLTKFYLNGQNKYGGEDLYDFLDQKVVIFHDYCEKVGLPRSQYHWAFSIMLKGRAADYYYEEIVGNASTMKQMVEMIKLHFETGERTQALLKVWRETTLQKIITNSPDKNRLECLELLLNYFWKIKQGLPDIYRTDTSLKDALINACRGIPECSFALYDPAQSFEGLSAQLRSSIGTAMDVNQSNLQESYQTMTQPEIYWTDRKYFGQGRGKGQGFGRKENPVFRENANVNTLGRGRGRRREGGVYGSDFQQRQKKCYVCEKQGCWSTKHSQEERQKAYSRFCTQYTHSSEPNLANFQGFLANYEGIHGIEDLVEKQNKDNDIDEAQYILDNMQIEDEFQEDDFETGAYVSDDFGKINGIQTLTHLKDQSVWHLITKSDPFEEVSIQQTQTNDVFCFDGRYNGGVFQGIMPDTGAAGVSTVGKPQFRALQILDSTICLDTTSAGHHRIRFGKGIAVSLGTIRVPTPFGMIIFHVVPVNTPFLFCLQDMDRMQVKFDNLTDELIQGDKRVHVVRKWGHPWMMLYEIEHLTYNQLSEKDLRRIHTRFGHPSTSRLLKILRRAGYVADSNIIKHLTKFCHFCQMHSKSPGRFRFKIENDCEFNYEIVVDVLHIDNKFVIHVVDTATSFQAARFLPNMSTKAVWNALRLCWIDVYLGPPDRIAHDAGKNFASAEFKRNAKSLAIDIKEVPVEAHNSIGKVERYHLPLRRAYEIIKEESAGTGTSDEAVLQMAVKAINDTSGPNGLIPTLLVFGAYPRLTDQSPPSVDILKRAEAIQKAMKEVRQINARRQVKDALHLRNGPNVKPTLDLPLQSNVRVWREPGRWEGPFKLLAVNGNTCTLEINERPVNFRSTAVKPYFVDLENMEDESVDSGNLREIQKICENDDKEKIVEDYEDLNKIPGQLPRQNGQNSINRGRGRPKGSKNKNNITLVTKTQNHAVSNVKNNNVHLESYISAKEQFDMKLALELRREGKIASQGLPFQESTKQEIEGLLSRDVFHFEQYNEEKHGKVRIFQSRMVNEIKGKATGNPYEKSRLVIQGYNDNGKESILTQSPTIMRASQRLLIGLAPSLLKLNINIWLRDITQAYTQSGSKLSRLILAHLPKEIRNFHPPGTIMVVTKPLYGIPEAGTHWWTTYWKHHVYNLQMETSTYDPCLLISTQENEFGVVGMQTDDTLILANNQFSNREQNELDKASLTAKPKEMLSYHQPMIFNGCVLTSNNDSIELRQKDQGKKIELLDANSETVKQDYVKQRARGAYIATICQPEASFDLSVAAQHQTPDENDIIALNRRLRWQKENLDRGLTYIPLNLETAKIFVFVDASFANNKDFSSQIGYEVIIANESMRNDHFLIRGNLIHWSSTKSKRVTRSVLASEICGMSIGADMAIALSATTEKILRQLKLSPLPVVVCTDSYSLYQCLVKLGNTSEKRLMIDIMALRQSYETRDLQEIRWINGEDNPADAMTKSNSNKALESFINTNSLTVRVEGWVEREKLPVSEYIDK